MAVRTSVFCVIEPRLYATDAGVKFVRLGFAQSAILIFDVDTLPVFESRIKVILEYGVFGEADEDFLPRGMRVEVFVCVWISQIFNFS